MFNLGFSELLVLAILGLIFIGPKQLPEVAKALARMLNEFKRATGDLTSTFTQTRNQAQSFVQKTQEEMSVQLYGDEEKHEHHDDHHHHDVHSEEHLNDHKEEINEPYLVSDGGDGGQESQEADKVEKAKEALGKSEDSGDGQV